MESMRQLLEETSGTLLECIDAELDAPEACAAGIGWNGSRDDV
jgi:hypothetical protein